MFTRRVTSNIIINETADVVWEHLNRLDKYPEWNPFINRVEGTFDVGSKLKIYLSFPSGKKMKFTPRVRRAEVRSCLEWKGTVGIPCIFDGVHKFELVIINNTTTKLIHSEEFSGLLVPIMFGSMQSDVEQAFSNMNNALKERYEG